MNVNLQSFWLPKASSTGAIQYDHDWNLVTIVAVGFFIVVCAALFYFMWKYRRRGPNDKTSQAAHNNTIEVIWTAIPLAIVLWLFVVGFHGFLSASIAPAESYEIRAIAQKWSWTFKYPNGVTTLGELRVPKGRPVKMIISSKDVVHAFYIPEFRVQQNAVPGNYSSVWFEPTEAGETALECLQYCGTGHSDMLAKVIVMEPQAFDDWVKDAGDDSKGLTPAQYGEKLYHKATCDTCHTIDGTPKIGPTFKGVFGRTEHLADGKTIVVDEPYIHESVLKPTAKVVAGFQPVMPTFQGTLTDQQIDAIIAFLKTVK